jgi:hypothetical protein
MSVPVARTRSLDMAGGSMFREGFVRPLPEGEPKADIDISLHYVLARPHDQPAVAGHTPVLSKSPFTITNDPVKSPILDTMLHRNDRAGKTKSALVRNAFLGPSNLLSQA